MIPDQADISTLSKLYHSGAWIPLGMLVAFFGLRAAATRVAWLKEDHRAVWVSAILGGAATLIVPLTQGTTPNISMIGAALMTVMALHADPKKTPAEQKQAQGGFVRLGLCVVIAMAGAMLLFGCSSSSQQKGLSTTALSLQVAYVGWSSYDKAKWDDIGKHCIAIGPTANCAQQNAAFEAQEKTVDDAWEAVKSALQAVMKLQSDQTIAGLEKAAAAYVQILTSLGVKGL